MKKIFQHFNKWFDNLPDGKRFFVFCLLVVLPIAAFNMLLSFCPHIFGPLYGFFMLLLVLVRFSGLPNEKEN